MEYEKTNRDTKESVDLFLLFSFVEEGPKKGGKRETGSINPVNLFS